MNRKIALILVLIILTSVSVMADPIIVGYYQSWSRKEYSHEDVPYKNLTHIAHAFIWPDENGALVIPDEYIQPELVESARQNGVKIVVSLGGWGHDKGFAPTAADPEARRKFVKNLTDFCKKHGYDGADLDWEYPASKDKDNFTSMMVELRESFDQAGLELLAAAVPSKDWRNGYDVDVLKDKLDWFGVMTYDFAGSWSKTAGHNSPFTASEHSELSVKDCMEYWVERGVPRKKVCMGLPFYGRDFKAGGLGKPSTGSEYSPYSKTLKLMEKGWTRKWDKKAKVPFLVNPENNIILSYDDPRSIELKCEYVVKENLGGVIIWALGLDDTGEEQPLLKTVAEALNTE